MLQRYSADEPRATLCSVAASEDYCVTSVMRIPLGRMFRHVARVTSSGSLRACQTARTWSGRFAQLRLPVIDYIVSPSVVCSSWLPDASCTEYVAIKPCSVANKLRALEESIVKQQ